MISEVFTNYQFKNKSVLLNVVDALLSPTRLVLGCKTIQYDPDNKSFREEDQKCRNVFYRILLAPIALLLLPVTLVACLIKAVEGSAQKVHQLYQKNSEKSRSVEENEPSRSGSAQQSSMEDLPSDKLGKQEQIFTREKLEEFRAHATNYYADILPNLTDFELQIIEDLLLELSKVFDQWAQNELEGVSSAHFEIERLKPHVFELRYRSGNDQKVIASERGVINTNRYFVYSLFEGYAISRQDLILGTGESRFREGFLIYHQKLLQDPYNEEHVLSASYAGKPYILIKQAHAQKVRFDKDGLHA